MRPVWIVVGSVVMAAACGSDTAAPDATVYFRLDAPFCSSVIPVQYSIDGLAVARDTLRVHLANEHLPSRGFTVSPGRHVVGARTDFNYVWPDTSVLLQPGQIFTDTLGFYCS